MEQTTRGQAPADTNAGILSRLIGVIVAPRQTFAGVVSKPKWLGMLLLVLAVSGGANFAFLSTEVGQQAMLDQQVRQTEAFGMQVSDEAYASMERTLPLMKYFTLGGTLVMVPLITFATAGILFGVFTALGGDATFRQALAVVTNSQAISVLGALFITPLNYFRESMSSATNLAVFFPMLDEGSFLARFFGMIDLFLVWWVIVLAIGLSVLYRRKTGPIAAGLFAVYGVIALGFAAFMSMRSGS
ncbi:MAG: YIP1 family protein [Vicinamibacterales bacterium]